MTEGASSSCQTAIVFLTDGKSTVGATTEEVSPAFVSWFFRGE